MNRIWTLIFVLVGCSVHAYTDTQIENRLEQLRRFAGSVVSYSRYQRRVRTKIAELFPHLETIDYAQFERIVVPQMGRTGPQRDREVLAELWVEKNAERLTPEQVASVAWYAEEKSADRSVIEAYLTNRKERLEPADVLRLGRNHTDLAITYFKRKKKLYSRDELVSAAAQIDRVSKAHHGQFSEWVDRYVPKSKRTGPPTCDFSLLNPS